VFALPEPRVGLAALAGGLHRLPRQVGLKPAMGMILTGRRVSAAEGERLGFINEVVPQAELMAAAQRWARQILECSPASIRASKASVLAGLNDADLQRAMAQRVPEVDQLFRSADFVEGPKAFAEKRPPRWQGN
jgi:enoyl-CoA hydratase/carnithine racemase